MMEYAQYILWGVVAMLFLMVIHFYVQQKKADRKTRALIHVIEASQELGASATIEKVMQVVCEMVRALFKADNVAVYLLDEEVADQPVMRAKGVQSAHSDIFTDFNPEITPSQLGQVVKERKGAVYSNFNDEAQNERVLANHAELKSVMISPLMFEGKPLGVMLVSYHQSGRYSEEIFQLYTLLSNQVALAIRNVQLQLGMAALAITDSLSGLYTHGYFQDHLGKEITKGKYANQSVALMIMDMDFFKKVNDNYGHPQGDALLKQLGGVIKSVTRPVDTVCRYGGDEFTVTMPETNRISAVVVAERIRQAVEEYEFVLGSNIVHITVSGGVAAFPEDAQTKKELLEKADQAMYEAKHKGRNKICFAA
ncbi:MAG: sensor domain-containing diguanylate cyclase [Candidatus Eremiobacterota bacterium]